MKHLRTAQHRANDWLVDILLHESAIAYIILVLVALLMLSVPTYFMLFPKAADILFIDPIRSTIDSLIKLLHQC